MGVTFFVDSPTGLGQVFGAQRDAVPLSLFPQQVERLVFPEGSFVFLDGGTLDLGIVRDSTLNTTTGTATGNRRARDRAPKQHRH